MALKCINNTSVILHDCPMLISHRFPGAQANNDAWNLGSDQSPGGFLSHGGTPSSHPFS